MGILDFILHFLIVGLLLLRDGEAFRVNRSTQLPTTGLKSYIASPNARRTNWNLSTKLHTEKLENFVVQRREVHWSQRKNLAAVRLLGVGLGVVPFLSRCVGAVSSPRNLSKDNLNSAARLVASAVGGISAGSIKAVSPASPALSPLQAFMLWLGLSALSALLTCTECAITKISPWKTREFAEQEGPQSPFATLSEDLTSLLITIMLFTTAASIYKTALIVATVEQIFPRVSLGVVTAALTAITLFFEELVPTSLAVANSEVVARRCVPLLSRVAQLLRPLTSAITWLNNGVLRVVGLRATEDPSVSEEMLRRVVDEAQRSEEGIETEEGRMIKAVLDMQGQTVSKIMQPRVDIVALPLEASASTVLRTAVLTKYSRVPIYKGDIDHIVGVVLTKDLLGCMSLGEGGEGAPVTGSSEIDALVSQVTAGDGARWKGAASVPPQPQQAGSGERVGAGAGFARKPSIVAKKGKGATSASPAAAPAAVVMPAILSAPASAQFRPQMQERWSSLTAADFLEKTYFIPETMTCWVALQELRKRRIHLAIVVDEYGGTAGLVSLEDLLEEVVGEIYDEGDGEDLAEDRTTIFRSADGQGYEMKGYAELDEVFAALGISAQELAEEEEGAEGGRGFAESSTIAGLLCALAGRIPRPGDQIPFAGYLFTVREVEDGRLILNVGARRIAPSTAAVPAPSPSPSLARTENGNSRGVGKQGQQQNGFESHGEAGEADTEVRLEETASVFSANGEGVGEEADASSADAPQHHQQQRRAYFEGSWVEEWLEGE